MASGSVVDGDGGSEEPRVYIRKSFKGVKNDVMMQPESDDRPSGEANVVQKQLISGFDEVCDDSSKLNSNEQVNGVGDLGFQENRVTISIGLKSKKEARECRKKLQGELDLVRSWRRKIEAKERDLSGVKKRVHSEVERTGPRPSKPLNQLSVSVLENSHAVSENLEKEKRTPKANQFYRNSEFILAKDKFPPADKKVKANGRKGGGEMGFGLGKFTIHLFKGCTALLERLMKHKHGWVFNTPVDAKVLGLHDYFDIIKDPMDLGTVKSKLSENRYKTPIQFAEDVRLTFRNAMTYNPKGQDVYLMAEQLLQIFEEKWAVIEAGYLRELKLVVDHEGSVATPASKKALTPRPPPLETKRALERSESITPVIDVNTKPVKRGYRGRPSVPKKPKARDPNKREMTYDEKQKLSSNLQALPPDKLESVVEIIKKRNSSLCQHDDEIEVDIDSFDTDTLWELDRFVINYKKFLSKSKKNADPTNIAQTAVDQSAHKEENPAQVMNLVEEARKQTKADKEATSTSSPMRLEKQTENETQASKSSSAGNSSSDSGSSSSDSGSGSSSG